MDSSDDNDEFERQINDLDKKLRVLEYNLSQASQDTVTDYLTPHARPVEFQSESEQEDYDDCTYELPFMNSGSNTLKIEPLVGSLGIPTNIVGLSLKDYTEEDFIDYDYSDSDEDEEKLDSGCRPSAEFRENGEDDDDTDFQPNSSPFSLFGGNPGHINVIRFLNGTNRHSAEGTSSSGAKTNSHAMKRKTCANGFSQSKLDYPARPRTIPSLNSNEMVGTLIHKQKRWSNFASDRISELDIDANKPVQRKSTILTTNSVSNRGGFFIAMQDINSDDTDYIQIQHGDLIKMNAEWGVNLHTLEKGKINSDCLLSVTSEVVVEMLTRMNISEMVLKDIEGLVDGFDEAANIENETKVENPVSNQAITQKESRNFKSTHCIESETPTMFFCWKGNCQRVAVYGSFNNYEKVVPLFFDSSSKVYVAFCESQQQNGDVCYFKFLVDDDFWKIDDTIPCQVIDGDVYNYIPMNCGEIQAKFVVIKTESVRYKVLPRMITIEQAELHSNQISIDSTEINDAIHELDPRFEPIFKHVRIDSAISVSSNRCNLPIQNRTNDVASFKCYSFNCVTTGFCYALSCSNFSRHEVLHISKRPTNLRLETLENNIDVDSDVEQEFLMNRQSLVMGPIVSPTNSSNESDYDFDFPQEKIEYLVEDYIRCIDPSYDVFDKLSNLGDISHLDSSDNSVDISESVDWYSPPFTAQSEELETGFRLDQGTLSLIR